jgi:RNA polymerase sigma-70 factor, ECF subfamily
MSSGAGGGLRSMTALTPPLAELRLLPFPPAVTDALGRYIAACERGEPAAIAALLTDDVRLTTPGERRELVGPARVAGLLAGDGELLGVPTWADGRPAMAVYVLDPGSGEHLPLGLDVLRVEGDRIALIETYSPERFPELGLPLTR